MSEINVTPFVDVMLVLLIVFMVTAPLLSAGVPVDLPEAAANAAGAREGADHGHRRHRRQDLPSRTRRCDLDELVARAEIGHRARADDRIYVRGDKAASYGTIMQVMGTINGAGFRGSALVALKETDG